jgi:hypothetical protein
MIDADALIDDARANPPDEELVKRLAAAMSQGRHSIPEMSSMSAQEQMRLRIMSGKRFYEQFTEAPTALSPVMASSPSPSKRARTDLSADERPLPACPAETSLSLVSQDLCEIPPEVLVPPVCSSLLQLDLSRNKLVTLSPAIALLSSLTHLTISRNAIRAIPPELGKLEHLQELHALSNQLRPTALSLAELSAGLKKLRVLDLRYNSKLKSAAQQKIAAALPWVTGLQVTVKAVAPPPSETCGGGVVAALRDASLLRSQLEPISTPQLRKRLQQDFGVPESQLDPEKVGRADILNLLLKQYEAEGLGNGRPARQVV